MSYCMVVTIFIQYFKPREISREISSPLQVPVCIFIRTHVSPHPFTYSSHTHTNSNSLYVQYCTCVKKPHCMYCSYLNLQKLMPIGPPRGAGVQFNSFPSYCNWYEYDRIIQKNETLSTKSHWSIRQMPNIIVITLDIFQHPAPDNVNQITDWYKNVVIKFCACSGRSWYRYLEMIDWTND